ncbi:unnamed protein product [Linum trigynum]|uniref:LTI65/LTI78 PGEED repeat domain-containing protein n=1 Tax=Linum trigynum TaxID=586398 RepID=A0AAV2FR12_9ROSI
MEFTAEVQEEMRGTSRLNRKGQQDNGVSVKDYLVEKWKPTEDKKALSDAISKLRRGGRRLALRNPSPGRA